MADIYQLREAREKARSITLAAGGGPPHNDDMEPRIAKLEALTEKTDARLYVIEKDLAVIRAEMKAHIAEAKNSIIMWVVSAILLAQLLPALLKKFGV